jgi:hypothetical protein
MEIYTHNESFHQCNAKRIGQKIIFTCDKCPAYIRTINLETGEKTIEDGIKYPSDWDEIAPEKQFKWLSRFPKHHGDWIQSGLDVPFNEN